MTRARSAEALEFYHTEALRGGWSVRQLDRQIGSLFYERTLLSRDKAAMLRKGAKPRPGDALGADEALRDPLVLEFLNLRDEYSETDLEDALVRHLETFLLELGGDFTFVGRQRRLRVGGALLGGLANAALLNMRLRRKTHPAMSPPSSTTPSKQVVVLSVSEMHHRRLSQQPSCR